MKNRGQMTVDSGRKTEGAKPHTNLKSKVVRGKRIKLTFGKYAIVDADDYGWLGQYNWCTVKKSQTWYAYTFTIDGKRLSMHRLVTNAPKRMLVDHINHNGLDNRKPNLRLCTHQQNQRNKRPQRGGSSKYKGVSWCKSRMKFRAMIWNNGKSIYLGSFESEIDAAKAYDKKAKELFGEFAYLNFPEDYDSKQNSVPFERGVSG